jgi:predicted Zn-dependent protease
MMGRNVEAEAACRNALELSPHRAGTHSVLADTLVGTGRSREALAEAAREPNGPFRLEALALIHHALGTTTDANLALAELIEQHADGSAYQIAEIHAVRGDVDAAFHWLERAVAQRDGGVPDANASPRLHSLHGDPRWVPFLRRLGFGG